MLILRIAYRNLFRHRRRTVLTMLTMTGGFVLSSVAIGFGDGTYGEVIDLFTRTRLGHIQVHAKGYLERPTLYQTIQDYDAVGEIVGAADGVQSWTPRLFAGGLISVGTKSAAARIIGIDPAREERTTQFSRRVFSGRPLAVAAANEAVLGKGLANLLGAKLGDEAVILSQGADGSIANDLYTIVGLSDSGEVGSNRVDFFLHLADAQELLALEGRAHEIAVTVERLQQVLPTARALPAKLARPELVVAPWQEFASGFYRAMRADRIGMWITLSVIILIVAVGVLNTVLMSVLERRREYGLLKALGARPPQLGRMILLEVNAMAVASIIVGAVLGAAINAALATWGITMPEPITYGGVEFSRMYGQVNVTSFVVPAATVLAAATLVSLIPAWQAGRTDPAAAMRTH